KELIQALVAGLDAECVLGRFVGGSHYARGFHATGTLGTFGAAAACANLLGLDPDTTRNVLGIAATQAAGLKSMFGTMCKPFHAGKAASNGLLAAQLGAAGFTSESEALEVEQGFALTHSDAPSPEDFENALKTRNHVPLTLFKYHAACYLTHSAMEGTRHLLGEHGFSADDVDSVRLTVDKGHFSVCNIQEPGTGLEAKFSLRFTTAMILHGIDTADIHGYTDELTRDPVLVETRDRVSVLAHETPSRDTLVSITLNDGRTVETAWNVAVPEQDLDLQWERLTAKFRSLSIPVVGKDRSDELQRTLRGLEGVNSLDGFFASTRGV
ncbi:MAG: MmgE/PrpD family protein, partial [Pseudomonadales bacterium]|nr:MmgE/PrpD family protein [Pseudomonadales bacterium]